MVPSRVFDLYLRVFSAACSDHTPPFLGTTHWDCGSPRRDSTCSWEIIEATGILTRCIHLLRMQSVGFQEDANHRCRCSYFIVRLGMDFVHTQGTALRMRLLATEYRLVFDRLYGAPPFRMAPVLLKCRRFNYTIHAIHLVEEFEACCSRRQTEASVEESPNSLLLYGCTMLRWMR